MTGTFRRISIATLTLALSGCVTQEKYNALKLERDQLSEQLGRADAEAQAAKAQADLLRKQLEALNAAGGTSSGLMANLTQQNADLQQQLAELNRRYQEALARAGQGVALPEDANIALRALADKYPDLIEFDQRTGMVKFKGDVTFASGQSNLTPRAREVIRRFVQILNSPSIANYDLIVAGHTDNVRVSNPATIQAGHKDNWYLSAHRAISVGEALRTDGVNPTRLGVAGYADQHPVASNATDAGKMQNRRVEVLILPKFSGNGNTGGGAALNKDAAPTKDTTPTAVNAAVPNKP
jgi:chemotaxis protein MotB